MAVQVDRPLCHAVPASEGKVAEHDTDFGDVEFGIGLHAVPARSGADRLVVVVAGDEVLAAVQAGEQRGDAGGGLADGEVAEVKDFVVGCHDAVPGGEHCVVHFGQRGEWAAVEAARRGMAEMLVAGDEERHRTDSDGRPQLCRTRRLAATPHQRGRSPCHRKASRNSTPTR